MINLTIKHFRYFDALARNGHFGRAAEACAISQPALSVQIKELEAMLGAPLVERAARQIRLTTLGEEFLIRARKVLAEVEAMADLARISEGPLRGTLRMGVIPTVAPYLLPAFIRGLSEELPGLELRPRESVTQSLLDDLRQSRLDFVVAALPVSEPALREFPLFDEEFVLVRAAKDAGKPVPSPDRLQEMKLLLLEEGHCMRDQALTFCNLRRIENIDTFGASSLTTLVQMVTNGLGLTLLPEIALEVEARPGVIKVMRFADPEPVRTLGLAWRQTSPRKPDFLALGQMIAEARPKPTTAPPA